nr:glycosyltransferase [Anaerobacillus isosaccharinicus]
MLLLIRRFDLQFPKHKSKFDIFKALEEFCNVFYWSDDDSIHSILKTIKIKPDFILQYDPAWKNTLSPKVFDLKEVDIPKGIYVNDSHAEVGKRKKYFRENKYDLIFSVTKEAFLKNYPSFKKQFVWSPFSIDPKIYKDWGQEKTIKYLLMGLVHYNGVHHPPKGRYPLRDKVLLTFKENEDFKWLKHPGHLTKSYLLIDENYAKELNKSEIFFTCGSILKYPVLKYFEVPACRTLLLAEPNQDILELGFSDNDNFIACNPDDVQEKALYYSKNQSERERITDNGYRFIHKNHTIQIRALQMLESIEKSI